MPHGFPTATKSVLSGEAGVNLVARIVSKELQWLFRRNHNEHDFGIDGYIDLITGEGGVTGRCLALQIKHGKSYLTTKEEYGYIYYGESKHINYLLNHPIPVVILICDPEAEICYWEKFSAEKTEPTNSGWKLTIPFENVLNKNSKTELEKIARPAQDYTEQLNRYWAINKMIGDEAEYVLYAVDRRDVELGECKGVVEFFERLRVTRAFAKKNQGKVDLSISGYEDDPRELWQIPEVKEWMKTIEPQVKFWFYFLSTKAKAGGLITLACSICNAKWLGHPVGRGGYVDLEPEAFANFLARNFVWLNEICEFLELAITENKRISFAVAKCFGFPIPNEL